MFIKITEIDAVIIYTRGITESDFNIIKNNLVGHKKLAFIVKYNDPVPTFISNQLLIEESLSDSVFGTTIQNVVNSMQVPSKKIVFVSKDQDIIKSILPHPVGTILINDRNITYQDIGFFPDQKITRIEELPSALNTNYGYFSEIRSTLVGKNRNPIGSKGIFFTFKMEREDTSVDIYALGRYYGSQHHLFHVHQLSKRINKSKKDDSQNILFSNIFEPIINKIDLEFHKVDGITRVPSRPSKKDRLLPIINRLSERLNIPNFSEVISCPVEYPSHKVLGKEERFDNVKGKFKVSRLPLIENKHIVLIDDVFTTGATVYECAKELYQNGVGRVTVVVLAVNQYQNDTFSHRRLLCPQCEEEMTLWINKSKNSAFFGHIDFKNNSCKNTEFYLNGKQLYNETNSINPIGQDEEEVLF
ncbi:ComF family protein [Bacillus haikouensis]|jgi:predicted amidophosphoribosyltransferase|uniref:ComF family protein n=1 Tax=Bacillus haikouensis TaxID=1510468 RepID=UPI00155598FE|nr:ComF family protein [Bacillus haikouensis]NQD67275.1 ComF family protein [Bacillus haikouensis]